MRGVRWSRCIRVHEARRAFGISHTRSERVSVAHLLSAQSEAQDVDVHGWIRSIRRQKKITFAVVGDGSTTSAIQAVLKPEDAAPYESRQPSA